MAVLGTAPRRVVHARRGGRGMGYHRGLVWKARRVGARANGLGSRTACRGASTRCPGGAGSCCASLVGAEVGPATAPVARSTRAALAGARSITTPRGRVVPGDHHLGDGFDRASSTSGPERSGQRVLWRRSERKRGHPRPRSGPAETSRIVRGFDGSGRERHASAES